MAQPHFIELDEAVSRIKQACEDRELDSHHPFFFMVGAGLSHPSVPLAPDIVSKCKEVAQRYGRGSESTERGSLDSYSYWLQTAYAEPKRRQKYLHNLIHGKPITHANFRLAHLLLSNKISNLVVTTNFDDFLAKALTLFGEPYIVCDHPQTVGRINDNEPLLQIVHLHGSYWFYDCCNLRAEVEERAQQSRQTTSTMASLLNVIMWDRSPLVIGYSGWEGDVFMEALKRRLATPLSSNVYWFCYSKSNVDSLPAWARENPNIWFVVPTPKPPKTESNDLEQSVGARPLAGGIQAQSLGVKKDDEPVLPADTVVDRLIQAFELEAPELTKDPLGFFATWLENSLPVGDASDVATDIYAIKSVIERVRIAKHREAESDRAEFRSSVSTLEDVRDAFRRADFREAVRRGTNIPLFILDEKGLDELADAMWSAAGHLLDNSEEELSAYDLVVRIWDESQKRGVVATGVTKAKAAKALAFKAISLDQMSRPEAAIPIFDEVIERFSNSDEFEVQEQVADAFFNKAVCLESNNDSEGAIASLDRILERYRDEPQIEWQTRVARALIRKANCLGTLDRIDEELRLYDTVIEQYTQDELQNEVGLALFSKANRLIKLNESDEAMSLYDRVINSFDDSEEPELREVTAKARFNKSFILSSKGHHKEAFVLCKEVVENYGTSSDWTLQELVGQALNGMAFFSIVTAKAARLKGDQKGFSRQLKRAADYVEKALEKPGENGIKLGNQAYIAFLLGHKEEAQKLLTQAIRLGGERIRQGELKDAFINELPEDIEFRTMVASV